MTVSAVMAGCSWCSGEVDVVAEYGDSIDTPYLARTKFLFSSAFFFITFSSLTENEIVNVRRKGFKKTENFEHNVLLLLFLFTLDTQKL